ncbi:MAG: tRNA 2-thiouridine(34) synthase MnmA [Paludibacteraceae bacterium]|nr:tRNA 2-thiouridine(34) synthase MnmA [Paludibacteraceae bacterium]
MKKSILLGMSGGTDSSVAAILLKEQGYKVTGISFLFREGESHNYVNDARELAQGLNIPHFVYDARDIFKKQIISYFIDGYLNGETPFPCAKCNNELKWKLLLDEADRLGIEKVAMGHYAGIQEQNGLYFVTPGVDPDKDQSFFLWGLTQTQLSRIIFPIGNYFKNEIRQIAADKGFYKAAIKKDSLGACFVDGDYRPYLQNKLAEAGIDIHEGNFIDEENNILGRHRGYPYYTVGQRHGLIYLNRKVYVKEIRPLSNEVILAPLSNLYKRSFNIKQLNFVDRSMFSTEFDSIVKIRYRKQSHLSRVIFHDNNTATIETKEALEAIASGQTAVFYRDGKVLGGGFIC